MSLPIDRTAKAALDANLVNGVTSDAPKLKANNDMIYNTIDELYNFSSGLVSNGTLNQYTQKSLAKIMQDMAKGQTVIIDARGDSTYYGYKVGSGTQVATPAPAQLQRILRSYYNNNNITVLNNGISGNQTTNALRTWDSAMRTSPAQVVFINYGINDMQGGNPAGVSDPAISAEQYKENLKTLVFTARKYNKVVILETPNVVTQVGNFGTEARAEGVKQFADAMRQVARELNVPLLDSYAFTEMYMSSGIKVEDVIGDGFHPTDNFYKAKGTHMASVLISPNVARIDKSMIVPAILGESMGEVSAGQETYQNGGSRVGWVRIGRPSLRMAFYVERPGLDIYMATPVWSDGSSSVEVYIDGDLISTISLFESTLTGTRFGADQEILIMKNAKPGLHVLEMKSLDNARCGLYYIRARETTKSEISSGAENGTISHRFRRKVLENFTITTSGGSSNHAHFMTDIPTSRVIEPVDVEVTTQLNKLDGIVLFTHPQSEVGPNGFGPRGGLYLYLDANTGYLMMSEAEQTGFVNNTTLSSVDYSTNKHTYRITVNTTGLATVYVDGVQVGTYTQTKAYIGGFLGFYKNNNSTTTIESVYMN